MERGGEDDEGRVGLGVLAKPRSEPRWVVTERDHFLPLSLFRYLQLLIGIDSYPDIRGPIDDEPPLESLHYSVRRDDSKLEKRAGQSFRSRSFERKQHTKKLRAVQCSLGSKWWTRGVDRA